VTSPAVRVHSARALPPIGSTVPSSDAASSVSSSSQGQVSGIWRFLAYKMFLWQISSLCVCVIFGEILTIFINWIFKVSDCVIRLTDF